MSLVNRSLLLVTQNFQSLQAVYKAFFEGKRNGHGRLDEMKGDENCGKLNFMIYSVSRNMLAQYLMDLIQPSQSHPPSHHKILLRNLFTMSKFSLTVTPRGHKQRKLNDHVYSFLLSVSSRPHYQVVF